MSRGSMSEKGRGEKQGMTRRGTKKEADLDDDTS